MDQRSLPWELEQITQRVTSGVYLNTSDFVRDAIGDELPAMDNDLIITGPDGPLPQVMT